MSAEGLGSAPDVAPVRAQEQLDWPRVEHYLRQHLPSCGLGAFDARPPMEVAQFPGGHSNLTYRLRFGETELVLRRPPFGPVAPSAHDMGREYRWLQALHPVFPLAPRVYLCCDDPEVAGAVFYVMERRNGLVVRNEEPPLLAHHPQARRRASLAVVDTLATLHAIDVSAGPLRDLGRPAGFVSRHVKGWTERWQRAQTDPSPEMESVAAWLAARLPEDPAVPAVLHGDYKLDNVMLASDDPSRVVAVLDWELCALGERLVDLGLLLTYWTSSPETDGAADALSTVTSRSGWLSRSEIVDRYAAHGHNVTNVGYYEVLARFKLAVVLQQIYFRYKAGQTHDQRFARLGDRVVQLAREAEGRTRQQSSPSR